MSRSDLDVHFGRIELLIQEIVQFVPTNSIGAGTFRADLAGLLVVTMAASYKSCVKDTIIGHAGRHHAAFGSFASNNFRKLNSRISVNDLVSYAKLFDEDIANHFKDMLKDRKKRLSDRVGSNIEKSYEQILSWRHDFAHAGIRNTTIEEAAATHRAAKRVLYCFDSAFEEVGHADAEEH